MNQSFFGRAPPRTAGCDVPICANDPIKKQQRNDNKTTTQQFATFNELCCHCINVVVYVVVVLLCCEYVAVVLWLLTGKVATYGPLYEHNTATKQQVHNCRITAVV